ncbi:hypothetical protein [Dactylosporangium maewongense]|uniref:hypothetical protein n=1 Tax=Dactylosporangium maewongense TaxID=634393 RepID=UPI0031CECA8C
MTPTTTTPSADQHHSPSARHPCIASTSAGGNVLTADAASPRHQLIPATPQIHADPRAVAIGTPQRSQPQPTGQNRVAALLEAPGRPASPGRSTPKQRPRGTG